MFEISDFYHYCADHQVDVIAYDGAPAPGVTIQEQGVCAVFLDFTKISSVRLLRGVCYHELGHLAAGALHKVDSPYELVERSEYRANRWAATHYLPPERFQEAFSAGYTQLWQLSEYFELPEQEIQAALHYWTVSRGIVFSPAEG